MRWTAVAIVVLQAAQAPAPGSAGPVAGTAVVRGRVLDKETGRPIARALVALRLPREGRTFENRTGPDGAFEFPGLPAGQIQLTASAGEHRATHVQTSATFVTPGGARTNTIVLKDGEVRSGADIALPRAFAINGRLLDDNGDPLAGVYVRALLAPRGGAAASPRPTDDRGRFRIFGLAPGRYFLCADIQLRVRFHEPGRRVRSRYPVPTCHPSSTTDDGEPVVLRNADIDGVEIRAARKPTVILSGTALSSSGEVAGGAHLSLQRIERRGGSGMGTSVPADGRFWIENVAPGRYILSVTTRQPSPSPPTGDVEYGEVALDVDSEDIEGLVLAMKAPARVRGRLIVDAGAAELPRPRPTVSAAAVRRGGHPYRPPVAVTDDLVFELTNLFGPQLLTVSPLPRGWIVKAIRYRGRDVTDLPTEFRTGANEIEIEVSTRGAVLSGRVTDVAGNAAAAARVVVFPAEPERWRRGGSAEGVTSVSKDGRFTLAPRRAGDYLVVAMSPREYAQLDDEHRYDVMSEYAERVTLLENERREIDLRLVTLPERREVR